MRAGCNYEDWRTGLWSPFSPSTLEWGPRIELMSPGLLHQLWHPDCSVCICVWMWSKDGNYLLNSEFNLESIL